MYMWVNKSYVCLVKNFLIKQFISIYIYIYKLCKSYTMFVIWVCVDV